MSSSPPARAQGRKVKGLYPAADLRFIPSGHCPHDDTPELANAELIDWLTAVTSGDSSSATASA
jgi:pimeloyl-ACP methyl ester carboxylesterase